MVIDDGDGREIPAGASAMPGRPPLDGVRVVCLGIYVPAPVAARRLSSLGAAVVHVEPPAGDPLADWCRSWYDALHAGHEVRRLDLKSDDGRAAMEALLADADLLLTAMRPAALARLALDPEALRARHPRLCRVAIVGHGGDDAEAPGHDLTYQASVGLVTPPTLPRTLLADLAGAERAVAAALALLLARERGLGAGSETVALADAADAFADPLRHGLTAPGALLGGALPRYALYPAARGWIAVAALEPHFWSRLVAELSLAEDAGAEALASAFLARDAEAWERWARERDLPLVAVRG